MKVKNVHWDRNQAEEGPLTFIEMASKEEALEKGNKKGGTEDEDTRSRRNIFIGVFALNVLVVLVCLIWVGLTIRAGMYT